MYESQAVHLKTLSKAKTGSLNVEGVTVATHTDINHITDKKTYPIF